MCELTSFTVDIFCYLMHLSRKIALKIFTVNTYILGYCFLVLSLMLTHVWHLFSVVCCLVRQQFIVHVAVLIEYNY